MPNNFMAIDQGLPRFTGEESLEQRVKMLQDYQYQLVEQLRYALQHLDTRNMNMDAMDQWGGTLTEPLYASLTDENGNMLSLAVVAEGISAKLWGENGDITLLEAKAEGLSATVADLTTGQAKMVTFDANNGLMVYDADGDAVKIDGEKVIAGQLVGEIIKLLPPGWENAETDSVGYFTITNAETADYALDMTSWLAMRLWANSGALHLRGQGSSGPFITLDYLYPNKAAMVDRMPVINLGNGALILAGDAFDSYGDQTRVGSYGYDLPSKGVQGQVYILLE